ncbi:hypothetical protein [Streptomyces sp. NBC_00576]|uniref:hypothetical protein n=1 Tax=Streptomyces sp. NBC_00576 TaxID=2903665 RepID=UPI002E81CFA7|nr:hypothetical protein [Streptomyces sp. NBC_00576]WUB71420.1 hypothetical protein OG734_15665 [Streptomyces sp. NBC_00576]
MNDADKHEPESVAEEPRLWQVNIALVTTSAKHEELMDRLVDVLCPDPRHEGPCPIPWAMNSVAGDSLSAKKRKALLKEIEETNGDPA